MLIDLRYHLTSLVAVFLALAVGILVGSSLIGGSSVKVLEREFAKLRTDNRMQQQTVDNLRERIKKQEEFETTAAPMLIENRLVWHRVAIIQTGDYSEATQGAKSIMEEAGASVVSVTTLSNLDSNAARGRLVKALKQITGETEIEDPVERMLGILAGCVAGGADPEALDVLENMGLLSRAGEYGRRVFYVVLVGGDKKRGSGRAQLVDLELIDQLKAVGVKTLVGAEPSSAVTSYIPMYHRKDIPTVDDIDLVMGKVALVYAVAGESGNFGIKKSAEQVAPDFFKRTQ